MGVFLPLFLSMVLLGVSHKGFSAEAASLEDKYEKLVKVVAMLAHKAVHAEKNQFAVGSIQQSILTQKQFQNLMGDGWVLCDGASQWNQVPIRETSYGKITGRSALPDCRGKFIRTVGGNAAVLGDSQGESTAVNGLSIPQRQLRGNFRSSTDGHHGHGVSVNGQHSHGMDSAGRHQHWNQVFTGVPGSTNYPLNRFGNGNQAKGNLTDPAGDHAHKIHDAGGHSHTIHGSGNHSHTVPVELDHDHALKGDLETRPSNITLNTFIKVN